MAHFVVTGSAGFIGSHLTDRLLGEGHRVTGVDNLLSGSERNLESALRSDQFTWARDDVSQGVSAEVLDQVKSHGLEGIFHMACPASPVDFDRIPFDILKVNSLGTIHYVDLAMKEKAHFLMASTSEVYGDPETHPQKETYWGNVNSIGPRACYDETKRFSEAYVSSAMRGKGTYEGKPFEPLSATIIRIFNTYGPRMRIDDGRVVPEFIRAATSGEQLELHGGGAQSRSFCFVDDLVNGILAAFEKRIPGPVNLGNPDEYLIRDFAKIVVELTGSDSKFDETDARPDDPKRRCPDISQAKTLLGWEPKVSLEDGLKKTIDYFSSKGP